MKTPGQFQLMAGVGLLALSILSLSCSKTGVSARRAYPLVTPPLPAEPEKVSIRVADAEIRNLEDRISLSGEVTARGQVNVMPEVNGLLTRLIVSPGDEVIYDQVIAYVDPSRPGMSYVESPVRSKAVGTVTAVPAISGNQVSVQTVIAQLGDLSRLEVETRIPERYLGQLELGIRANVVSRAFPDLVQNARITEIAPVVDPRSRTVKVRLEPDSMKRLRPGQAVAIDLILDTRKDVVVIPLAALTERRTGTGAFVVDSNIASWRVIETGSVLDGVVEVVAGLAGDESVVVAGMENLTDGSAVRIVQD